MLKRAVIMLAVLLVTAGFVFAQININTNQSTKAVTSTVTKTAAVDAVNTDKPASDMPKAPAGFKADFEGQVISVENLLTGGNGRIDKATAENLLSYGKPIAFLSKGVIYFVFDAGGNFAGNKLAKLAEASKVGIAGKVKTVKGLKYIIANGIYAI
jgi:hypothetical protein